MLLFIDEWGGRPTKVEAAGFSKVDGSVVVASERERSGRVKK